METTTKKRTAFQVVNDRILSLLHGGIVPWKIECMDLPYNLITKKRYRGVNVILLASDAFFRNPILTAKQVEEMGAKIVEDAKPRAIVYWKYGDNGAKPQLRYTMAYNTAQCYGNEKIGEMILPVVEKENPVNDWEALFSGMADKPKITHHLSIPCYDPNEDTVNIPDIQSYPKPEEYYADLFRQLIHATGHPRRLNRPEFLKFSGKEQPEPFSAEELISEMGVFFLQSITGIRTNFNPDKGYIEGWINKLEKDSRLMVYASAKAQKAVDFILGTRPEMKEEHL